jgi:hypothetical protein
MFVVKWFPIDQTQQIQVLHILEHSVEVVEVLLRVVSNRVTCTCVTSSGLSQRREGAAECQYHQTSGDQKKAGQGATERGEHRGYVLILNRRTGK